MSGGAVADRLSLGCLGLPSLRHLPCHPPRTAVRAGIGHAQIAGFTGKTRTNRLEETGGKIRPRRDSGPVPGNGESRRQRIAHPLGEKRPGARREASTDSGMGDDLDCRKDRGGGCRDRGSTDGKRRGGGHFTEKARPAGMRVAPRSRGRRASQRVPYKSRARGLWAEPSGA